MVSRQAWIAIELSFLNNCIVVTNIITMVSDSSFKSPTRRGCCAADRTTMSDVLRMMLLCDRTYAIINGLVSMIIKISLSLLFLIEHVDAIVYSDCRLVTRKFCFARRLCPVWNNLPNDIVNASSLN